MSIFLYPIVLIALNSSDVERAILSHLNSCYPVVDARYVCDVSRLNLSNAPVFDSVVVDSYGKDSPRGQVVVCLSFFQHGQRVHRLAGNFKISLLKEVLIASGSIKAGERFTLEKAAKETRDIALLDEAPLQASAQLEGMTAAHFIPPGRVLTISSFRRPPLLSPGDRVEIHYARGSLVLKADGIVKENGFKGKNIMVMNVDSRKTVNAVVIDSATVAVGTGEDM